MKYEYHFLDSVLPEHLQDVLNNQGSAGFKLMTAQLIQTVIKGLSGPRVEICYHLIFEKPVVQTA